MARRMELALAPLELSAQQFTTLALLAGHETLATTQLADLLGTERTTVTRNLNLLVKRGLIERAQEDDRRVNAMRLTRKGHAVYQQALPLWEDAQVSAMRRVKDVDASQLLTSLKKL